MLELPVAIVCMYNRHYVLRLLLSVPTAPPLGSRPTFCGCDAPKNGDVFFLREKMIIAEWQKEEVDMISVMFAHAGQGLRTDWPTILGLIVDLLRYDDDLI